MITKSLDENNKVVKGFRYTAIASFSAPTIICIYVKELQVDGFLPPPKNQNLGKNKKYIGILIYSVCQMSKQFSRLLSAGTCTYCFYRLTAFNESNQHRKN